MLNQTSVESAILQWLVEVVEVPHPELGDWPPCPFARQARLNKSYLVKQGTDPVADGIELADHWDPKLEVVILWYKDISVDQLVEQTEKLNQIIIPKNFVALEGHPDLAESINGVDLRFKLCPTIVFQQLDKLNQASDQLRTKGYYNSWDQKSLDKIVNFRYNNTHE